MLDIWVEWLGLNYSGDTIEHPALSELPGGEAFIQDTFKINSHNFKEKFFFSALCIPLKIYHHLSFVAVDGYYCKTINYHIYSAWNIYFCFKCQHNNSCVADIVLKKRKKEKKKKMPMLMLWRCPNIEMQICQRAPSLPSCSASADRYNNQMFCSSSSCIF